MRNIVTVARSWIGTPFRHQGRKKNIGCDCLGLIMGVAKELDIQSRIGGELPDFDKSDYHMLNDGKILETELERHLHKVKKLEPGVVALFSFDNNPQHLGVISNHPSGELAVIHAHIRSRKVVEHRLDSEMRNKIKQIYKFYGV